MVRPIERLDRAAVREAGVALVVDDDPHVLETVHRWLARARWVCVSAASVSEALRLARDPSLSLALIDYRLDLGDVGVRLGSALRRRRALPFVLFSGHLNANVTVEAIRAGALGVLEKPLTEARVRESLLCVARAGPAALVSFFAPPPFQPEEPVGEELRPTAVRWAWMVLKACRAAYDPKTIP